jgi:hypothetical protein
MRRAICLFLVLLGCTQPPAITWPEGPVPATPALVPAGDLLPPLASIDPGPGLVARAAALRSDLGL